MDAGTHRRRLDRSFLHISPLLTLQAGSQLLVSAVCHLLDQVQTLFHLKEHTHTYTSGNSRHISYTHGHVFFFLPQTKHCYCFYRTDWQIDFEMCQVVIGLNS